jgi:hypothetical protein
MGIHARSAARRRLLLPHRKRETADFQLDCVAVLSEKESGQLLLIRGKTDTDSSPSEAQGMKCSSSSDETANSSERFLQLVVRVLRSANFKLVWVSQETAKLALVSLQGRASEEDDDSHCRPIVNEQIGPVVGACFPVRACNLKVVSELGVLEFAVFRCR